MVTYVLDSSAVLRFLDDEAGAARVSEIIKGHIAGTCRAAISALHWGEIAGITCKRLGQQGVDLVLSRLYAFGFEIVAADDKRAVRASQIKVKKALPYVEAFAVELTAALPNAVLVTADFDFKPAARDVKIEFLPTK